MDVTGPATEDDDTDVGIDIGISIGFESNEMLLAKISAEHDNVNYDANYFTAALGCWYCKGACPLEQAIAAISISPFVNHEGR
jgi:hypothetical protein